MIAAGHTLESILHYRQPGFPYRGWSWPQWEYFVAQEEARHCAAMADEMDVMQAAVGSLFDKSAAAELERMKKKLRAER